ncbi:fumarylacetoacetate hydrolase family protein [Rubripirellula amarantea]|nr:fumarylacetoacetate hydrolase family protein [Rubripirellula amarantea]
MKLCRFQTTDGPRTAIYHPDHGICPVDLSDDQFYTTKVEPNDTWLPMPERLLPPVPNPEKIICIGLNYRDHAIETGSDIPTEPVVFSKFNTALVGHGDAIILPKVANRVDYEAELVVVIGKSGRHVHVNDAMDHVFGFTCGHDVSARDWQKGRPGGQWLLGKSFDTFAPLGPCVVSKDEIPDPANVRVRMHLNGDVVQDSTTAQLIFDIPTLISHLSQIVTLKAGDLIYTGTPPGVGAARNPPVFLAPGDQCAVEIDGIGRLENLCQAEA